ncbi:MAG TPA: methyltransferase [Planctomycetes bacterium]|nr:methyltransferase [Planctomycetota bacterium]
MHGVKQGLSRLLDRFAERVARRRLAMELHPLHALEREASQASVAYIRAHMAGAIPLRERFELLDYALAQAGSGLYLELGVHEGESIRRIARRAPRVYGFDTFSGLPERQQGTPWFRGRFDVGGRLPRVPGNVELIRGDFRETLPGFLAAQQQPVAFVHVDCDLYASTKGALDALADRLPPGAILLFDDYFNYPGWEECEHRALLEFARERERAYEYLAFARHQVCVRLG